MGDSGSHAGVRHRQPRLLAVPAARPVRRPRRGAAADPGLAGLGYRARHARPIQRRTTALARRARSFVPPPRLQRTGRAPRCGRLAGDHVNCTATAIALVIFQDALLTACRRGDALGVDRVRVSARPCHGGTGTGRRACNRQARAGGGTQCERGLTSLRSRGLVYVEPARADTPRTCTAISLRTGHSAAVTHDQRPGILKTLRCISTATP